MATGDFWTQSFSYIKDNDMGTTLRISWPDCSSWSSSYSFRYKMKYGGTTWTTIASTNPNVKIATIPDTTYVCQVAVFKAGVLWGYSLLGEFKADSYNSSVSNATTTSLDLTWTNFNTGDPSPWVVDQYLRYRVKNSTGSWIQKYAAGGINNAHLTGLTANTDYEFQVYVYLPTLWGYTPVRYFKTASVKDLSADNPKNSVDIYPNPFVDEIHMDLFVQNETDVIWKIYDMTGKLVFSGNENVSSGFSSHKIDAPGLTPGLYILNTVINDQTQYFRILKQ